jgi:pumilio RNA-binding family
VTLGCSTLAVNEVVARQLECHNRPEPQVRQDTGKQLPPYSGSYRCLENYQSSLKCTEGDGAAHQVRLLPATLRPSTPQLVDASSNVGFSDWWNEATSDTTLAAHWLPHANACPAGVSGSTQHGKHGTREPNNAVSSNGCPFSDPEEIQDAILLRHQSSRVRPLTTFGGHNASPIGALPCVTNGQAERSYSEVLSASTVYVPAENGCTLVPVTLWHVVPMIQSMASAPKMAVARCGGTTNQRSKRKPKANGQSHRAKNKPLSVLEQFCATTEPYKWTIHQIEGHIVSFCEDQNGSRFVQQRLQAGDAVEHQLVIQEVLPSMPLLRDHVFGNYVVQKLLLLSLPTNQRVLQDNLVRHARLLSFQSYACRVMQTVLETIPDEGFPRLLEQFHHDTLSCILDGHASHVMQKMVEAVSQSRKEASYKGEYHRATFLQEQIDFILNTVAENAALCACHVHGCRVARVILQLCVGVGKVKVLDNLMPHHQLLLNDEYGNFIVQNAIQFGRDEDRAAILQTVIRTGILSLSVGKITSNVIETLLKHGSDGQRRALVREMMKVRSNQATLV